MDFSNQGQPAARKRHGETQSCGQRNPPNGATRSMGQSLNPIPENSIKHSFAKVALWGGALACGHKTVDAKIDEDVLTERRSMGKACQAKITHTSTNAMGAAKATGRKQQGTRQKKLQGILPVLPYALREL